MKYKSSNKLSSRGVTHTPSPRSVAMRGIKSFLFRPISRIKTLRDDEAGKTVEVPDYNLRERQYSKAFTLIELLVVVLIIGILTAIALPMYQVSVEKSRITNLMPLLRAIANEEEIYYLENGAYTDNISLLSIDGEHKKTDYFYDYTGYYELPNGMKLSLGGAKNGSIGGGTEKISLSFMLNHLSPSLASDNRYNNSKIICFADSSDSISKKVCENMGTFIADNACAFLRPTNAHHNCKMYRVQ